LENLFNDILEARKRLRVVKIIPKQIRQQVALAFQEVLAGVIATSTIRDWRRLLTFAYVVLRLPPSGRHSGKLSKVIQQNLADFRKDKSLSALLCQYPYRKIANGKSDNVTKAKIASSKLAEGDIKSAVRVLMSSDKLATIDADTLDELRQRHPAPPNDFREYYAENASQNEKIYVSVEELTTAVKSFPLSSAGGFDGFRPRHLKDMLSTHGNVELLSMMTEFCGKVINGELPQFILKYFYGASLTAFRKKAGGLRPIACGLTLRRLAAKILIWRHKNELTGCLLPNQVGCGVQRGAEAAAHAVRTYLEGDRTPDLKVMVKLDYRNTFNTVRRDWMLEKVSQHVPTLLPMVRQAYQFESLLFGEGYTLRSQTGVQQGDPCGPALFCLALKDLTDNLTSNCSPWYLDDGILLGTMEQVLTDLKTVLDYSAYSGLELNSSKCEIFLMGGSTDNQEKCKSKIGSILPKIRETTSADLEVLGVPIFREAIQNFIKRKTEEIQLMCSRLSLLSTQQAIYLLRNSLSTPRITYLLRCSPAFRFLDILQDMDNMIIDAAEETLNITCDPRIRSKLTLPLRLGGLGIRKPTQLSLPCYLSSLSGCSTLIKFFLPPSHHAIIDDQIQETTAQLRAALGDFAGPLDIESQSGLDDLFCKQQLLNLEDSADTEAERARLLAARTPLSRKWLQALPSDPIGTLLTDFQFRVGVGLKLGGILCHPHICRLCGKSISSTGEHALNCRKSQGRHSRHSALNEEVKKTLVKAQIPALREPPGMSRDDGRRPDGITLVPWERGKSLMWDVTVVDTLAATYIHETALQTGAAAERADEQKRRKYSDFSREYIIAPLAIETLGPTSTSTWQLLTEIGRRLRSVTRDARSGEFFLQHIALHIVRGNAASVLGALMTDEDFD